MATQFAVGGAVIPFVTLLLRDRGFDIGRISLVFSASSATLMIFPFLWGMLADRLIPLNRLFTFLNLAAGAALIWLWTQRDFAGSLAGFTMLAAFLNPTFMLVNALSFHHLPRPNEQFGRLRSWGSLGWMVPFVPISLWLALSGRMNLEFTLGLGFILALGMAGLTFRLPHTPCEGRRRVTSGSGSHYGSALRRLLRDPNYVTLVLAYFCVAGSFSILTFYSFPLLEDLGVPRAWLGPVQAVGVIFEWALFQWQSVLLRRWKYTVVILVGCAALFLRQLFYASLDNVWILSLSYVLAGVVVVCNFTGTSLLVNAIAGPEVRATAQTMLVLCGSGLGPTLANWAAGRLSHHYANSLRPVFLFAAALAGLAGLLILARGRRLDEAGRRQT
jgi:MFS family permease